MKTLLRPLALLICALALLGPTDSRAQPRGPRPAAGSPQAPVPVHSSDPSWGSPLAPVTLVHFYDLQCPYSQKMRASLDELKQHYGQSKLRIVYKQFPLAHHKPARPAAEAAVAVYRTRGRKAFERFVDASFDTLRQSGDHVDALRTARLDPAGIERAIRRGKAAKQVDDDIAFGKAIGVRGTPASFVNGLSVSGARPVADLKKTIDGQLATAKALRAQGVPASRIYTQLSKQNFVPPPQPGVTAGVLKGVAPKPAAGQPAPASPKPADTVWKVPVGRSPTLGPANAPVTLVVFSEFQCPFCAKLKPTLEQLTQKYGAQLRIVFKHNPLPFHKRAEPAAQLSMEAFRRRGSRGFWEVHDQLFAQQRSLEDADLEQIAAAAGLNPVGTMKAIHQHKHRKHIDADQELAVDLEARGTPSCFVNGRRLTGARPLGDFEALIDEELAHARKLRAKGVPAHRIYKHIQKGAKSAPPPPKKNVPRAGGNLPSKGPRHAPVTIQIFSDFECPFCGRVGTTLDEVQREFGGKVRLVWRHLPLPMHSNARSASLAAAEAHRQQGNAGFWRMHDLLFENQRALDRAALVSYARQLKLDVAAFEKALDTDRHGAAIDRDLAVAKAASIHGTPGFAINGYFISGAQPIAQFRKVIRRALREAGRKP